MTEAVNTAMTEFNEHIQAEMNREARELNNAVNAAREHIIRQLMLSRFTVDQKSGTLQVHWAGPTFDENPTNGTRPRPSPT